ncbi:response regulator [Lyngbya aestuarii]|uniref:response regulator n=1 Tax=Lyngbya aestuarii TaxID=118322 RepID=UPI00403E041C
MTKTILIIEDDELFRSMLFGLLEMEDFNVISAADGSNGLILAKQLQPDLVISDINLPYLNGLGVLNKLRNDLTTAHLPFMFLTSKSDQETRSLAMKLGANAYLTKPVHLSNLLEAINNHLKTRQLTQ